MATEIVLEKCEMRLTKNQFCDMDNNLALKGISEALKLSSNGKAPGVDGIPHELYQILDMSFEQSKGYVFLLISTCSF
jgi:hypothetical protein